MSFQMCPIPTCVVAMVTYDGLAHTCILVALKCMLFAMEEHTRIVCMSNGDKSCWHE